jgi:hypothetical protein
MKKYIFTVVCCLFSFYVSGQKSSQSPPSVYVDGKGVMRWSDTHQETSFFGVNYTLPFAHAYRAMGYLGINRKEAIDRDVYHFARLGFNAYRIHIWDVEVSDKNGNLLENDHLDLLDYLISKLKERGISMVLTAQTNFGNGYPEKNEQTGGFSYDYDKCDVHANTQAIAAQENYIYHLIKHINPYTKKAYKDDTGIVGFEINNEPCHSGTPAQTKQYIDRMLKAMKRAGNKKPVFYNVSHNRQQVEAYYSTNVEGTTYQWYPIGLVAGHTRKGNFLPYVDSYDIPFDQVKGFHSKAKLVYEFDPADITYSYMYPAMTRTFRGAGFQWITQFAYDPIDMAWANTEYQTHFLNLAYTPSKAISMKIAAEAAYAVPRNKSYGTYPNDTVFDAFRVSYQEDLSVMNSSDKFYYSNSTTTQPIAIDKLQSVAGCGSSSVIASEGTGAYFADKLEDGLWRLEVMPDAVQVKDPFEKPSLKKEVVSILWNTWNMKIALPGLGQSFSATGLNEGNTFSQQSSNGNIALRPGVYLLQRDGYVPSTVWQKDTHWKNIFLGEFVAPKASVSSYQVIHTAPKTIEQGTPMRIEATVIGPQKPDSVILYSDKISFWNPRNTYYTMKNVGGYRYETVIPTDDIVGGKFRYTITACRKDSLYTFPAGVAGSPLDWDYYRNNYWESSVVAADIPIRIITPDAEDNDIDTYSMPEWASISRDLILNAPTNESTVKFYVKTQDAGGKLFIRKWIRDDLMAREKRLSTCKYLCMNVIKNEADTLTAGFISTLGYTYKTMINQSKGIIRIPLSGLAQVATALLPCPYPVFLKKYFEPVIKIPFNIKDIESVELTLIPADGKTSTLELGSVWLE